MTAPLLWVAGLDERGVNTSTPRLGGFRPAWAIHNVWRGGATTMTLRAPPISSAAVLSLLLACCASHLARGITGDGAASSRWHAVSRAPLDVWILAGCAASQAQALLPRQAVFLSVHEGLTSPPPFFAARRRVKQGSYASLFALCNLPCEQPLQLSPEPRACLPAQPPPLGPIQHTLPLANPCAGSQTWRARTAEMGRRCPTAACPGQTASSPIQR